MFPSSEDRENDYAVIHRDKPVKNTSELQEKRKRLAEETLRLDLSGWKCCKGRKCFSRVNEGYLKAQRKRFMLMSQAERKLSLNTMLRTIHVSGRMKKKFFFDGLPVCARFLDHGFGMSRFLQCAVKETPKARGSKAIVRMPILGARESLRDSIRAYIENLAASTANRMPDSDEMHLPYFEKRQVYEHFRRHWREHDGAGNLLPLPTYSYFISTWKAFCGRIKCRRVHRFPKCDICEKLRQELGEAGMDRARTDKLRDMQSAHYRFVERERMYYYKNRDAARTFPRKYASIIIDGASQSGYELPHWPYEIKETQRGHKIGVHLTGILEHASPSKLMLLTMTGEHKTGANHVIEGIHRWLSRKAMEGRLPNVLLVQMDNCTRENKNRFFLSYIECLVSSEVFEEAHVSFLPVGHTHEDIDQAFSCTSKRLRTHSAIALPDLLHELSESYTPRPYVNHMLHVINFSALFEASKCLAEMDPFSHWRFFRFSRDSGTPRSQYERVRTTVSVKETSDSEWEPIREDGSGGFLKFTPDIFSSPPTITTPPDNFAEVSRGIAAAESRIADSSKMKELEELRDTIYFIREDPMHWNRFLSPESVSSHIPRTTQINSSNPAGGESSESEEEMVINYCYSENDLVAVRTNEDKCPFWLALVTGTSSNRNGVIHTLEVLWLEAYGDGKDPFASKYRKAMLPNKREWSAEISVKTVLVRLNKLKRDKTLSVDSVKRIEESLSAFE